MQDNPEKGEQFIRRLEELKQTTRALIAQANKVSENAERTVARLRGPGAPGQTSRQDAEHGSG